MDREKIAAERIESIRDVISDYPSCLIICAGKDGGFGFMDTGKDEMFDNFDAVLFDLLKENPVIFDYLKGIVAEVDEANAQLN